MSQESEWYSQLEEWFEQFKDLGLSDSAAAKAVQDRFENCE